MRLFHIRDKTIIVHREYKFLTELIIRQILNLAYFELAYSFVKRTLFVEIRLLLVFEPFCESTSLKSNF